MVAFPFPGCLKRFSERAEGSAPRTPEPLRWRPEYARRISASISKHNLCGFPFALRQRPEVHGIRSAVDERLVRAEVVVNPDAVAIGTRLQTRFGLSRLIRYLDVAKFEQATRSEAISRLDGQLEDRCNLTPRMHDLGSSRFPTAL